MDFLQLVFGFVNAPLFATFLLGMFWKRTTGHGAFTGLLSGTGAAALTHGLTVAEGKGGWIADAAPVPLHHGAEFLDRHLRLDHLLRGHDPGEPGHQAAARPELEGLVYGLTKMPHDRDKAWYLRPAAVAVIVGVVLIDSESLVCLICSTCAFLPDSSSRRWALILTLLRSFRPTCRRRSPSATSTSTAASS